MGERKEGLDSYLLRIIPMKYKVFLLYINNYIKMKYICIYLYAHISIYKEIGLLQSKCIRLSSEVPELRYPGQGKFSRELIHRKSWERQCIQKIKNVEVSLWNCAIAENPELARTWCTVSLKTKGGIVAFISKNLSVATGTRYIRMLQYSFWKVSKSNKWVSASINSDVSLQKPTCNFVGETSKP